VAASNLLTSGLTIPPAAALNAAASGPRGLAAAGARSLVPLIYGRDRVPALILNVLAKAGDATIVLVQCLWGHALDGVESVTYNDQALPAGATVTHYTGSQTTADTDLVAAFAAQSITYTDTLAGYGYSVVALPAARFDGQLNFGAQVRGRRVYDPRLDSTAGGSGSQRLANPATWTWSINPALALGDWLASTVYGAGLAVDWTSVGPAANANDANIGSPAEPRRQLGLTIARDGVTIAALGEALRAYAGCWLVPGASGMKLLPDADASAVASYSHGSGQIAGLRDVNLRDLGSSPTAVEIQFTDTSQVPWREASATATLPGAGTTLPWRLSTVAMPGVQRYSQAYREAVERLNKLTLGDLSLTLEVFDEGLRHEQADIVTVTHPVGLTAKPMRVMGVQMSAPGRWVLELTEHDPAAYSTAVQTAPSIPDTTRVPPDGPSQAVASFAGTVSKGRIVWTWAPCSDVGYGWTELRSSDANWGAISPAPVFRGAANTWGQVVSVAGSVTLYARHFGVRGNASAASTTATVSVTAGDLVQDGTNGTPGATGANGQTSYLHIKYSNDGGSTFTASVGETPGAYIGTYTDFTLADSTSPGAYTWALIKGADGTNGTPGATGANGQTSYLHIKYSNDGGSTFTASVGETPGAYIGTYTDFTLADSTSPGAYSWALIKGADGSNGANGSNGAPGADAVSVGADKAAVALSADSTGLVDSGQLPTTVTAWARSGVTVDTGSWSWTRTSTSGITTTISGAAVTITAMSIDSGEITITGTRSGYSNISVTVPVTKIKRSTPSSGVSSSSGPFYASSISLNPYDALAFVEFRRNGTVYVGEGSTAAAITPYQVGEWAYAVGSTFGDNYQIRFDDISGNPVNAYSSLGTWYTLNSTVSVGLTEATSAAGKDGTVGFAIRRTSDNVVVLSGICYVTVFKESGA